MRRLFFLLLAAAGCAGGHEGPRSVTPASIGVPPLVLCARLAGAGGDSDALDPESKGFALLRLERTSIGFSIRAPGLGKVTATHIHHGSAGQNGPMLWEINPGFAGDSIEGEAADVPPGVIRLLAAEPSEFYVKLHTVKFPGGAIRGQLGPCVPRPGANE
jgi:hypothetical protein